MKEQHTQSSIGQSDWDRERNRNDMNPRTGAGGPEQGRPYPQSGPSGYPESHQQLQAQRDHPGTEYFSGSTGYGGRGDYPQQQQGQGGFAQGYGQQQGRGQQSQQGEYYGGGSWSRSENEYRSDPGQHQQEAFQPGAQHQQHFASGRQQYGQGQHRETQHSQYGRGGFEEEPFRQGGQQQHQQHQGYGDTGRWTSGYSQSEGGRRDQFQGGQQFQDSRTIDRQAEQFGQNFGHQQHNQFMDQPRGQEFHGYGGRMSGQSNAGQSSQFGGHYGEHQGGQQSQGYGGFQSGQPSDYGNQQQGQFMGQGSHSSGQQPSGGYGAYGAYQVGSQPQHISGRSPRPPKDYARSDERIRELICEHLAHHHSIDASEVSIQVKDGRVTLEGSVPDRRMKHEIEDVADGCWGVKDVDNRIRVGQGMQAGGQQQASGQQQSGRTGNMDSAAQGWLAVPADILTGGASTEAAQGKTARPEDMSTVESSGSGMSAAGTDATRTGATAPSGSASTIASGREAGEDESKTKGK